MNIEGTRIFSNQCFCSSVGYIPRGGIAGSYVVGLFLYCTTTLQSGLSQHFFQFAYIFLLVYQIKILVLSFRGKMGKCLSIYPNYIECPMWVGSNRHIHKKEHLRDQRVKEIGILGTAEARGILAAADTQIIGKREHVSNISLFFFPLFKKAFGNRINVDTKVYFLLIFFPVLRWKNKSLKV